VFELKILKGYPLRIILNWCSHILFISQKLHFDAILKLKLPWN